MSKPVINLDTEVSDIPRAAKSATQRAREDAVSPQVIDARVHELNATIQSFQQESLPVARETLAALQDGFARLNQAIERGDANTEVLTTAVRENTVALRDLIAALRSREA